MIKNCITCNKEYEPLGPAGKYCPTCVVPSKTKEYVAKATMKSRLKKGTVLVGIGSGNHPNNNGRTHSQYIDGRSTYIQTRVQMKENINECERCGKDLSEATKSEWVCHHKDRDRTNSSQDNLELLCKRCHQVEHKCWDNFNKGVTE